MPRTSPVRARAGTVRGRPGPAAPPVTRRQRTGRQTGPLLFFPQARSRCHDELSGIFFLS